MFFSNGIGFEVVFFEASMDFWNVCDHHRCLPVRFQALAKALQTTPARLVWAHGASDMILRTALAAAKRAEGAGVCLMVGGCP